ncbi:tagaturonate reductase [Geosporobacter ferrireducens]|uniref:Altronate oxidoreductase n=1 Tax=Geosporobacter ferrireducens TaxID=1424294 RepID=A0A1D8GCK8_9FIRM|nr:tagaturonate reductase [Geosporobacter ferrireducens]AOT68639.1 altronate oxidoreductase [Geosporobacter ferrireducens]MTI54111.1 tagaturonate reductase [Geosporobacter ferrireducens]
MKRLSYQALKSLNDNSFRLKEAPERVLQFGEGNFLRGFVDYFIDILNETQSFNSKVVVVQPIANGLVSVLNEQEGLYTLYLRGFEDGEKVNRKRIISCISRGINPYEDFEAYLNNAKNPELRYIVSNTTEAGIVFEPKDQMDDAPPSSFPAKLTRLLYERFKVFGGEKGKGFVILSCELIDNNGIALKNCVDQYASKWNLGEDFTKWVTAENIFCSTLVDRIVTGYPREEAENLNAENHYEDKLINTAEVFASWVIEGPKTLADELPFEKAGLPVMIVDDHTPYKKRKVRILNGAHTSMVLAAYLAGKDIVRDCMEDDIILSFMKKTLFEEIIPTLTLPQEELLSFANAVIERFKNPYIDHELLAISLNSVSKWRARVLPSMKAYIEKFEQLPSCIVLSFAALMAFYTGTRIENGALIGDRKGKEYKIIDNLEVLEFFAKNSKALSRPEFVSAFASNEGFFGEDLTKYDGFVETVVNYLDSIDTKGMEAVLKGM